MTSLRQRLVKTSGPLMKHARYYWYCWLILAEKRLTWQLFGSMPWRMAALPLRTGWRSSKEGGGRRNVAEIA